MAAADAEEMRVFTEGTRPYRIVHASEAWCRGLGFRLDEVLGATCKILQGPETYTQRLRTARACNP